MKFDMVTQPSIARRSYLGCNFCAYYMVEDRMPWGHRVNLYFKGE